MRRLLAVLRADGDDDPRAPQPTLSELDSLLDRTRKLGVEVTLHRSGTEWPLPPSVDLSAYRILQEALTNVGKHAAAATVRIDWQPDVLELLVRDSGRGQVANGSTGADVGHGLIGMRERARIHGGTLSAEPTGCIGSVSATAPRAGADIVRLTRARAPAISRMHPGVDPGPARSLCRQRPPKHENAEVSRAAVAASPLVLVPALGIAKGGFLPDTWVWAGTLPAWAAAVALVTAERAGSLCRTWGWPAAGAALLLWTAASAIWSVEPSQSLLEARRTAAYVAFVLALVVLARRGSGRVLVPATHAAISLLVAYALFRYLLEVRTAYPYEGYLLSQPLGYANAVGILGAMGTLLALPRLADPGSAWLRGMTGGTVPLLLLALELSASRASWLALAAGLATAAALHPSPLSLVPPLSALAPLSALLLWVGHHSQFSAATSTPRWSGGLVAAVAVVVALAAGILVGLLRPRGLGRALPRRWAVLGALLAAAAIAAAWVSRADPGDPRRAYYHVAWHEYAAHPGLGSGAGTFGRAWVRSGLSLRWGGALDAHSLYLETLAELGPGGLLLLGAFLFYPLRRLPARLAVPGVPAAAAATLAFLVHSGLDWDWELPAVVLAGLACAGAIALGGDAEEREDTPLAKPVRATALASALLLGAASIVGARSATKPSAAVPFTREAPLSGASRDQPGSGGRYLPLP